MGAGNILTNESPCHNFCVLSVAIVYFQVFGCSWSLERFRWDMIGERLDFPAMDLLQTRKNRSQRRFQPFQSHLCSGIRQPFATVNTPDAHWRQGPTVCHPLIFFGGELGDHTKVVIENSGQSQSPPCNRDRFQVSFSHNTVLQSFLKMVWV